MTRESEDPTVVRSVAVTADDAVAAIEAARRGGKEAVLRVTPPFSGRMRARIHVPGDDDYDEPAPVHIDPPELLADDAPPFPTPAMTEDELRDDPGESYSRERHREYHADRVAEWRDAVSEHFAETVTVETDDGPHEVSVSVLG